MTTRSQNACRLAAALTAALALGGCQLLWVSLERLFPQEKVPAKFKLPAKKTVLVFADDLQNPVSYPPIKRALNEKLSQLLKDKGLVAQTIGYDKLVDLQSASPDFNLMSIPKIGRKLGADMVVYVNIEQFTLKDNLADTLWRGRFSGRVKVVDVLNGRICPEESAGYPVKVIAPAAENTSGTFGGELAKVLAENLAVEVTGLFHDHYVDRARPKRTDFSMEQ